MVFSGISFLYFFLPLILIVYAMAPKRLKNGVLLVGSLLFYCFGEPIYVILLILSSVSDYLHSLYIEKRRGTRAAKIALISSVIINLTMLGFFKYADFFIGNLNGLLGTDIPLTNVKLPIGISFFTFQTMSYTIDVYRGRVHAQKNLATFATFVCLFPQLIAGPIVRYSDLAAELESRTHTLDGVYLGVRRFVFGLAKKVLIADAMGALCSQFRVSEASVVFCWVYAIAVSLQIYFDFSGYSDMAIGLGRIFGFHFPENFDYPFTSGSITEFWRRWHMTLGGWFRDYLYIPLGGNRVSRLRWVFNIAVVWAATGLWHGAAWNFILWGLLFGLLLVLEKCFLNKVLHRAGSFVRHAYVIVVIALSFVIFQAESMAQLGSDVKGLFGGLPFWNADTAYYLGSYAVLLLVAVVGSTPLCKKLWFRLTETKVGKNISAFAEPIAVCALLLASTAYLVDGSFSPFLYFRF